MKESLLICLFPNIFLWPLLLVSSQYGFVVNLFNPRMDDLVTLLYSSVREVH